MPNDVNDTPPEKGKGDDAYKALAAEKGIPLDEKLSPRAEAFFKQLRETEAHATTPEMDVTQNQAPTLDFDLTESSPKPDLGGPPPTVPPKEPPSGGGDGGEGASGKNPWIEFLEDLFKDKFFKATLIGLVFLIVGYTAYYWINKFNNSPEVMERQANHIKLLKEMEEVREKSASRSIFSSNPTTSTSITDNCVVTAQDRANNNFGGHANCTRIKYEQMRNDPGMYFDFGKGARISSIEGQYRLLNGRELLCQTENPSEEKFSTDGCASVLSDKRLTSIGLAPLHQDGIIVTFNNK